MKALGELGEKNGVKVAVCSIKHIDLGSKTTKIIGTFYTKNHES